MERQRKAGALPSRTQVQWDKGAFEPLQKDLGRRLRKGRGLRLKNLATLGLAAEASGFSVHVQNGRLVLTHADGQPLSAAASSETTVAASATTIAAAAPQVAGFLSQFMDQELALPADS